MIKPSVNNTKNSSRYHIKISDSIFKINDKVTDCYLIQNKIYGAFDHSFLLDIIKKNQVENILDVGTGEGSFILELETLVPKIKIEAIDANENLILAAIKKRKNSEIDFKTGLFDQNYTSKTFGLIIARFAVEHMSKPSEFLINAFDNLAHKGCLAIVEYHVHFSGKEIPIWKAFKDKEIELYKAVNSNPNVTYGLTQGLAKVGFSNIKSQWHCISPSTVGSDIFFSLIITYAHLYNKINDQIWTSSFVEEITSWSKNQNDEDEEPSLMITHTVGQKIL